MSGFLNDDYQVPTSGGGDYTKFQVGDTTLRILSKQPVIGYEYWNNDNKPVRCQDNPGAKPADMREKAPNGGDERVKEFWAMVVYNYETEKIELLQATQVAIKSAIQNLSRSPKWGHPSKFDITISKKGTGLKTEYTVVANPPEAIHATIMALAKEAKINPAALLTGGNPFEAAGAAPAPAPAPAPKAPAPKPQPKAQPKPQPVAAGEEDLSDDDLPF